MVFSSLSFLFFFLPLVFLSYFLIRTRTWRNAVLLLFSLLFYSWGEPKFLLVMILASMVGYLSGLMIERNRDRPESARRTVIISAGLLLANLFFFKYIDLYRGKVRPQRNPFRFLLYASFFPQLIAGPIVRYETIENELTERRESLQDVYEGLKRFILGLGKKLILANNLALVSEIVYAGNPVVYGTAMYWLAAICYSLQLYFDFSGYSDMAIGLGRIFGFRFPENFNHPYLADSLTDHWRRWHISLGTWFRDYVYIPLGGNRVGNRKWVINVMLVWTLTGLWHGAAWNYIIWGGLSGAVLIAEKQFFLHWMRKVPKWIRIVFVFLFVTCSHVCFNMTDLSRMGFALRMMFSSHPTDWLGVLAADTAISTAWLYVPLGLVCCFPLLSYIPPARSHVTAVLRDVLWLGLFGVCIMFVLSSTYNPFIYFRF